MNKLLILLLLIPMVSFSQTWDCESNHKHFRFAIFERDGKQINYLTNDSDSNPIAIEILEETPVFIFAHSRRIKDKDGLNSWTLTLNKKLQTFALSLSHSFSTTEFSETLKGNCKVYDGKRIPKP